MATKSQRDDYKKPKKAKHPNMYLIGTYCMPIMCITLSRHKKSLLVCWETHTDIRTVWHILLTGSYRAQEDPLTSLGPCIWRFFAEQKDHFENKYFIWVSRQLWHWKYLLKQWPKPTLRSFGWNPQAGRENPPPASHTHLEVCAQLTHYIRAVRYHILKCSSLYSNVRSNVMMLLAT